MPHLSPDADVVVVLNYRGSADTLTCVESLRSGSPEAVVVVVDNGSGDDILEQVRARWPGVTTLQTGSNLGFAGGMNVGLLWAIRHQAGTITALNNDTIVAPGAISALAATARTGAVVSPEIRYADRDAVWFAGGTIDSATNLARHLGPAELAGAPTGLRPTQVLAGCSVTACRTVWESVGLFDERYFLNFEDSDWSVRAASLGVPLVVDTGTVIRHRVSASFTGAYTWLGLYYYTRNGLLFGRERLKGSMLQSARYLRRHVLPSAVGPLRRGDVRTAARSAVVIAYAVRDHVLGRYGRAPRSLERFAARLG